jgi:SAM-dependent methyltransferase
VPKRDAARSRARELGARPASPRCRALHPYAARYAPGHARLDHGADPRSLGPGRYTTHWRWMRDDPATVRLKQRRCRYVADRLEAPGKRIVDFGSGAGLLACYLAAAGAREVIGVEIVREHLEFSEYLKGRFGASRVRFTDKLDMGPGSVDAVILANVITHLHRPYELLAQMRDMLRPGGLLFVEDNNNAASPLMRRGLPKVWAEAEAESETARPGVEKTYGITYEQAQFWADRPDPPGLHGYAPLDPQTGTRHENAFHPREMAHALVNIGFAVKSVRPKYVFDFKQNSRCRWRSGCCRGSRSTSRPRTRSSPCGSR